MNGINTLKEHDFPDLSFAGKKVAILGTVPAAGGQGGAERLYQGLVQGFKDLGCIVKLIEVPADEPTFEQIEKNYIYCQNLDLVAYDLVVSTKVPTYAIRHPNHVLYLVHTVRTFDDMFSRAIAHPESTHYQQRARLHQLDFEALKGVKARFAIGHEVAKRLQRWLGLDATPLHPPLGYTAFRPGVDNGYFFLPGRLHPWKRVDLLIQAVLRSTLPLQLIIAGTGEAEADLRTLAQGDPRISFLGRISDEQLVARYADALAVPFVPLHEDYGYITLEAFASAKPVITCNDSGEPNFFVRTLETGLVAQPTPESLCTAMEWMFTHREQAAVMGENGRRLVADMSWRTTAAQLAAAGFQPEITPEPSPLKVTVVDMQPITPPTGGGRLRLLGLYHALGAGIECRYVGTYDWPGEAPRAQAVSPGLFEITVPLSEEHHRAANDLSREAQGKGVIDLAFSRQGTLSPAYVAAVRQEIKTADVVIFSHPWVFPLVQDQISANQLVIYDSHNVEGFLRALFLDESNPVEAELLRQVVADEWALGRRADWILACSTEDLVRFNRIYGFSPAQMRVIPNGVMAFPQEGFLEKESARKQLGIAQDQFLAIFLGSNYGPNVEAARFIADELAATQPKVHFIIAGSVGTSIVSHRKNVQVTGFIDEATKSAWLAASDVAINPMRSGSGTNIKMFEFMAWNLPVITTTIGARGIDCGDQQVFSLVEPSVAAFDQALKELKEDNARKRISQAARKCVEDGYAWERISAQLGTFLTARSKIGKNKVYFSVIVPSYERPQQLTALLANLQKQIERDFEVIIVDQSNKRWEGADAHYGVPLTYFHSPVKGAVRARNTGAMLAQGEILVFVDDDCLPHTDWLLNARPYFKAAEVTGLEGLIESDHLNDPAWRPVTNVGFEGVGFMTANLFVRSSAFHYLGGFDLQFDQPHFREDTELGWRMLQLGPVPFGREVVVFHPAQPRAKERESLGYRNTFFKKDALLYKKHPQAYKQLFFLERHYEKTPGFIENLMAGFQEYAIEVPDWLSNTLDAPTR